MNSSVGVIGLGALIFFIVLLSVVVGLVIVVVKWIKKR